MSWKNECCLSHQLSPGPLYEDTSAQPKEEDEVQYSSVHFKNKHAVPLYCTVQSDQPREQEPVHYAAVSFRNKLSSDGASGVSPTGTDTQIYSDIKHWDTLPLSNIQRLMHLLCVSDFIYVIFIFSC